MFRRLSAIDCAKKHTQLQLIMTHLGQGSGELTVAILHT